MTTLDRTLVVPGCRLAYADLPGPRTPVVFLHGAGADHRMFEGQAAALSRAGHRCVLTDLRGHGASRPCTTPVTAAALLDDARALLDRLDLHGAVLAGLSLGGNIAQALVREAPRRFAGLVAMSCTWNTGPLTPLERLSLRLAAPVLAAIPQRLLPRLMARASAATPAARADAERTFAAMPKRAFLEVWKATADFVAPDPGYRTPVPLLLVRGARDRTGNIATAMPAWAAFEGIAERPVAGAGHLVCQDAPDEVRERLLAFLRGLPRR